MKAIKRWWRLRNAPRYMWKVIKAGDQVINLENQDIYTVTAVATTLDGIMVHIGYKYYTLETLMSMFTLVLAENKVGKEVTENWDVVEVGSDVINTKTGIMYNIVDIKDTSRGRMYKVDGGNYFKAEDADMIALVLSKEKDDTP